MRFSKNIKSIYSDIMDNKKGASLTDAPSGFTNYEGFISLYFGRNPHREE